MAALTISENREFSFLPSSLASLSDKEKADIESHFRAKLASKRDLLCAGLADLGFRAIPPQGTYFATTDVTPLGFSDGEEFSRRAPVEAGVVVIPQSALSDHPETTAPYVRWAFCKQPAVLQEALDRLAVWLT